MARPPLPPPPLLDPAWYPDPTGRYEARYWDGRKWTSHISHYGATGADPLLRARFDHWWLRGLFRIALWAAFFGAIWWAFNEYWPTDERDLAADETIAGSAVLATSDLPEGWSPAVIPMVSPLTLMADDEGLLPVEVCQAFADDVEDSLDEPTRRQSFQDPGGARTVAHTTLVGHDGDLAGSFLGTLREPESGACVADLWAASSGPGGGVTVTATMAMTDPAFGDEAAWWRLTGTPAGGSEQVADLIAVRVDRALVEFVFVGTGAAVPVDVQRDVIAAQTGRLQALFDEAEAAEECADSSADDSAEDGADAEPCPVPTVEGSTADEAPVESETGDGG